MKKATLFLISLLALISVRAQKVTLVFTMTNDLYVTSNDTVGFEAQFLDMTGDVVGVWNKYDHVGSAVIVAPATTYTVQFRPIVGKSTAMAVSLSLGEKAKVNLKKKKIKYE